MPKSKVRFKFHNGCNPIVSVIFSGCYSYSVGALHGKSFVTLVRPQNPVIRSNNARSRCQELVINRITSASFKETVFLCTSYETLLSGT